MDNKKPGPQMKPTPRRPGPMTLKEGVMHLEEVIAMLAESDAHLHQAGLRCISTDKIHAVSMAAGMMLLMGKIFDVMKANHPGVPEGDMHNAMILALHQLVAQEVAKKGK